jgi:hypothetical protein
VALLWSHVSLPGYHLLCLLFTTMFLMVDHPMCPAPPDSSLVGTMSSHWHKEYVPVALLLSMFNYQPFQSSSLCSRYQVDVFLEQESIHPNDIKRPGISTQSVLDAPTTSWCVLFLIRTGRRGVSTDVSQ